METLHFDIDAPVRKRELTLPLYIRRRNGVPAGARGGLRNMLYCSLGAGSFAGFWRHWNPLFGFLLGKYVFAPFQRIMPPGLALVSTFAFCGGVHDLVARAARGSAVLLFTPWFLLRAIGLLCGRAARMDLSGQRWVVRATANLAYGTGCLAATLAFKRLLTLSA